ncbi:MAG: class I SAM-dependent methyltransferase [Candidatus Rokuibacteriota bacterium]
MTSGGADKGGAYFPALRFDWLTRFYDPILRVTLKEEKFKRRLLEQAGLRAGHRVLDLGCGTATLTILIKQACPEAHVVGLDADPRILAIARKKAADAGIHIELRQGLVEAPPFGPASFDRVVSSLVFHHLTTDRKRRTLEQARALLSPGGELHVADWGQAGDLLMRAAFVGVQLLDGFETTSDNVRGRLLPMMRDASFVSVAETHRERTILGTLSLYRAMRP